MYDHISDVPALALSRFAEMPTDRSQASGCVHWLGAVDRYGYGYVKVAADGKRYHFSAHRLSYLMVNDEIPAGFVIDHLCRARTCINPAHLEAVTNAENLRRGRPLHQETCKQGHPLSGDNVYPHRDGGRRCRECGRAAARRYQAKRKAAQRAA